MYTPVSPSEMKYYVHLEQDGGAEFTALFNCEKPSECTVEHLSQGFAKLFNEKSGSSSTVSSTSISLTDARGKAWSAKTVLSKVPATKNDIYVEYKGPPLSNVTGAASCVLDAAFIEALGNAPPAIPVRPDSAPAKAKETATPPRPASATTAPSKPKAAIQQTEAKPASKKTSALEPEVTATLGEAQQIITSSLEAAAEQFKSNQYKRAFEIYEQVLQLWPDCMPALYYSGVIELACERYNSALKYLKKCAGKPEASFEVFISLGDAYLGAEKREESLKAFQAALKLVSENSSKYSKSHEEQCKMGIARVFFEEGNQDVALSIITGVLQENEGCIDGLILYAEILDKKGIADEAVRALLRALVARQNDVKVKKLLAKAVKKKGGMDLILKELNVNESSAAALAFLAVVVKENGALNESVQLYRKALDLRKDSASYALNLAHVLEIRIDFAGVFQVCRDFLKHNPKASVGSLGFKSVMDLAPTMEKNVIWTKDEAPVCPKDSYSLSNEDKKQKVGPASYSDAELDLLAVCFTIVKVMYVCGEHANLGSLIQAIDPLRYGRDLHLTTIRNENAYFSCVKALLPYLSEPRGGKPFYVVGDSHSLAPGFQQIHFRDEKRLLITKLVTGLKMWHLRPESTFFPKTNFNNMIRTIPQGSDCIFLFGEIDCREGILMAVEKHRYKDLEQGMQVVIDIYINCLRDVVKVQKFNIFIHPVVPVLNETRSIVKSFNILLKKAVLACGFLKWLDMFDCLLSPDGGFNKKYDLDGTHLSPSYVPLLEQALKAHA